MAEVKLRDDMPEEQEAVRTTIVGGRPPGPGKKNDAIPRGMEVLIKKASVDRDFYPILLAERSKAAKRIGLELDPSEAMMLDGIPDTQLVTIIGNTRVKEKHIPAFMGYAAAAMLAAAGLVGVACNEERYETKGIDPDTGYLDDDGDEDDTDESDSEDDDEKVAPTGIRPDLEYMEEGEEETTETGSTETTESENPTDVQFMAGIQPDSPEGDDE
jgi:hypothetical protein